MHSDAHIRRHIGWGTTTLALAATITALTAATAAADVESQGPNVWDCSTGPCNLPSSYIVGHTYSFSPGSNGGMANNGGIHSSVSFYADGTCLGGYTYPHNGDDSAPWVPTTAGAHKLTVRYMNSIPFLVTPPIDLTVTVVAAAPGSPAPKAPPAQGSCIISGSSSLFDGISSASGIPEYPAPGTGSASGSH